MSLLHHWKMFARPPVSSYPSAFPLSSWLASASSCQHGQQLISQIPPIPEIIFLLEKLRFSKMGLTIQVRWARKFGGKSFKSARKENQSVISLLSTLYLGGQGPNWADCKLISNNVQWSPGVKERRQISHYFEVGEWRGERVQARLLH